LVDLRDDALAGLPDGVRVDVVALTRARLELPPDLAERAAALRAELACATPARVDVTAGAGAPARVLLGELGWPAGLPAGARHGFTTTHHRLLAVALPELAAELARAADVRVGERTLVLGTEELMAVPLRLAAALADAGHDVRFSTTTRSPAVVADGPGPRYAYNVARSWDHVLVVVEPAGDTTALRIGLLPALAPHTRRTTVV